MKRLISPLEGETAGRPEGGVREGVLKGEAFQVLADILPGTYTPARC